MMTTRMRIKGREEEDLNANVEVSIPIDVSRIRLRVKCPESLKKKDVRFVHDTLQYAVKRIQNHLKRYGAQVSWTYQTFEASLFWAVVLHRPLRFKSEIGDLRNGVTLRELINPRGAAALRMTNQGVVLDMEHNWLILVWDEAVATGVLHGLRHVPAWKGLLQRLLRRSEDAVDKMGEKRLDGVARHIAASTAFLVPHWVLHRTGYFSNNLFWLDENTRQSILVYDLAGVNVPAMDMGRAGGVREMGLDELLRDYPTPRSEIAHFYTSAKHEFREAAKDYKRVTQRMERKEPKEAARRKALSEQRAFRKAFTAKRRGTLAPGTAQELSYLIQDTARLLGFGARRRRIKYLPHTESLRMLRLCCKRILLMSSDDVAYVASLRNNDMIDSGIIDTKRIKWSATLADKIRHNALDIETLSGACRVGKDYAVWGALKDVDDGAESIIAWARKMVDRLDLERGGMSECVEKKA